MRRSIKTLAIVSALATGLAAASALQAQDSPKQPRDTMLQRGGMGMMGMMTQMNRMMSNCNRMMEGMMRGHERRTPGATPPKPPAEKKG